jgi:lipopolysaccharide export system protein LptC
MAERLAAVAPRPVRGGGARRRLFVSLAKRVLPVAAVALLALVALWPEFSSQLEQGRYTYHVGAGAPEGGALTDARYRGVDQQGRPFTVTAALARQAGHQRTDLTDPKADITLGADGWLMVQARKGVYMQGSNQLDLSGDVTLYRDDGTTLTTDSVTVDLGAGAASSAARVHVEGPFGTLDAQGFTVLDRGAALQFTGPGRLVLSGVGR